MSHQNAIKPTAIRQVFILLIILLIGVLIFKEMLPYFSGVLGAITIYVLMRPWMSKLVKRGWKPDWAAAFLMFISFIGILLPVAGIVVMLGNKIGQAVNNSQKVTKALKDQIEKWEGKLGYDLSSQIDVGAVSTWISENLQGFAGGTFTIFIAVGIMYFMLYYMLTNRRQLKESLYEYIPINRNNLKAIGKEVNHMVRSNALGIPMVALAQGIIALIGFFIFGIQDPFFWFVIVTIGSMIPFVGTLIGIVPVFLLTLSAGSTFQAWGILIYGLVIVGATDNIIRLYVLKKLDDVHPLITLIGVIVGVPLFGFIGLIFGPLLISLFIVVVRIYKKEYGKNVPEKNKEML
ncbi:AI-2E family transporter [Patiriisocius marinistellae]|uniref:AI-2E family transporter n=1 Tax=Patiriisocius marinistellae TaxID=2494560 RepID=A0A5J4G3Z2_9FLAO|nr:AI-2E family transporter [Patiriisocius marinistellae]GEQ87141.1 AI-2E family transporter [Patiriisocius marinistellae]